MKKQQLSFLEILAICIGSIVGTGIFLIPGIVAGLVGPGTVLIWAFIGLLTIPMGFCFAELASMFERSGGPVVFTKSAFGSFWGFIAGWTMWILATATISSLAIAIAFYASFFLALDTLGKAILSISAISCLTLINYFGVKTGARAQIILTFFTLVLLGSFIAIGAPNIKLENFSPWFPLGLGAVSLAMALSLEPFVGWEACTIIAGEVRNARKYIPKAIALTTILIFILYMLIITVAIGAAGWQTLAASAAPLAEAVGGFSIFIVVVSILVGFASLNSWVLTTARLPYALAKEKLFLRSFSKLSKYGTPGKSLLMQALLACVIAATGNYELSIFLLLSAVMILYALSFLSLIKLRKVLTPKFKVPKVFPYIAFIVTVFVFAQIEFMVIIFGIAIITMGVPGYVAIKLKTDKTFVEKFWDRFYFLMDIYIPILFRGKLKKAIKNARIKRNHTVLDYGCGSGISTEIVSKKAWRVVAADLSKKQLKRTIARIRTKHLHNVILVKVSKPAPFPPRSFDRILCTVSINYFVQPQKELRALCRTLKKGGVASFLALAAPGIPEHDFLKHDWSIKQTFNRAGFKKVSIEREKSILKEYIYITAIK